MCSDCSDGYVLNSLDECIPEETPVAKAWNFMRGGVFGPLNSKPIEFIASALYFDETNIDFAVMDSDHAAFDIE